MRGLTAQTFGELVGGPADGVQMEADDPTEPDDWPDYLEIDCRGGVRAAYRIRSHEPTRRGKQRVYLYDFAG